MQTENSTKPDSYWEKHVDWCNDFLIAPGNKAVPLITTVSERLIVFLYRYTNASSPSVETGPEPTCKQKRLSRISRAQRKNISILWKWMSAHLMPKSLLLYCFRQNLLCTFGLSACGCKMRMYCVSTVIAPSRIPCVQYIFMEHQSSLNDWKWERKKLCSLSKDERWWGYCLKRR